MWFESWWILGPAVAAGSFYLGAKWQEWRDVGRSIEMLERMDRAAVVRYSVATNELRQLARAVEPNRGSGVDSGAEAVRR